MKNWYKDWFDSDEYLEVYAHRDTKDAENLLYLIQRNMDLPVGSKVLDAACGSGRFSNLLAESGFRVFSFDLSPKLLKVAQEISHKRYDSPYYFRADLRNIPICSAFHLVLNMFTSFGYFKTDDENFSFIRDTSKLVVKDGYFIFDFLNKDYVIENISPSSKKVINGKKITEERKIKNNRVEKRITIKSNIEKRIFNESVYMYAKDEIIKKFNSYDLNVFRIFGDYKGGEFEPKVSERLIIIFKK